MSEDVNLCMSASVWTWKHICARWLVASRDGQLQSLLREAFFSSSSDSSGLENLKQKARERLAQAEMKAIDNSREIQDLKQRARESVHIKERARNSLVEAAESGMLQESIKGMEELKRKARDHLVEASESGRLQS